MTSTLFWAAVTGAMGAAFLWDVGFFVAWGVLLLAGAFGRNLSKNRSPVGTAAVATAILIPALIVVTYDISRVEYTREYEWGSEVFLQTTERRLGIPVGDSFELVSRQFAEPGPETTIEVRTETVEGPRYGAICSDGWRSSATGRGACSWHGGVSRWLTRDYEREFEVEVPVPPPPPPPGVEECQNSIVDEDPSRCSDVAWARAGFLRENLDIRVAEEWTPGHSRES